MNIKAILAAATVSVVACMPALAQDDVIKQRQGAMKTLGGQMRTLAGFARGQADYDAATALEAFTTMNEAATGLGELFPTGSETGGDTEASPEIWADREGFEAAVATFQTDTAAAVAAAPADLDAFKAVFGKVAGNCSACHEKYRVEKN